MPKRNAPDDDEVDIFEDDDVGLAQRALEAATSDPKNDIGTPNVVEDAEVGAGVEGEGLAQEPHLEATDAHLKLRVRPSSRAKFDEFKTELSVALGGARLMDSNVGRAVVDWFMAEGAPVVLRHLEANPPALQRPASDDQLAMAEFDGEILRLVTLALQRGLPE